IDPQRFAQSVIGLDQCPYGVLDPALDNDPRGRAGAALELVANHAGTTANIAFGDWPVANRRIERRKGMLRCQWKALDVTKPSVIGLGDDREVELLWSVVARGKRAYRVAHNADLIRVRDADRRS